LKHLLVTQNFHPEGGGMARRYTELVRAYGDPMDVSTLAHDGLKATTPAAWKKEEPSNNFRWMQFRIPKGKDDKEDAELAISKGLGGGAKPNVERWKKSFTPPAGKTVEESSKVEEIKIGGAKAMLARACEVPTRRVRLSMGRSDVAMAGHPSWCRVRMQ